MIFLKKKKNKLITFDEVTLLLYVLYVIVYVSYRDSRTVYLTKVTFIYKFMYVFYIILPVSIKQSIFPLSTMYITRLCVVDKNNRETAMYKSCVF